MSCLFYSGYKNHIGQNQRSTEIHHDYVLVTFDISETYILSITICIYLMYKCFNHISDVHVSLRILLNFTFNIPPR